MKIIHSVNRNFLLLSVTFLLIMITSCQGQKMVQKISDAKKLEFNKEQFIGKPLRVLLDNISPKIKYVFGNPENTWSGANDGTYLRFHFVERDEYKLKLDNDEKLTAIVVTFPLDIHNAHKSLPKPGLKEWTAENTEEYGDMIVAGIRVIGEN